MKVNWPSHSSRRHKQSDNLVMKSGSYRTITNKRRGAHDNKTCSVILLLLSTIILLWLGFLLYSLKSGRWHSNSEPSLNYVNGFLNVANKTFRDGLSNLPHKAIPENIDASGITDIHVIFSTDCSPYQDWQSLVMFYSATAVGQKGPVTRIASGCDDEKKETLTALYKKLYPKYHVHFTPDFKKDEKTKRNCKLPQF